MLGDGCLSCYSPKDRKQRKVIVITGSIYDDRGFFEQVLVPLLESLTQNSVKIKDKKYCGALEIHISDKNLFNKIESFSFPVGKKGASLSIPKIFYKKDLLKYILKGFLATDGSLVITKNPNKYYPRLEGNGISQKLIRQIVNYSVSIGMEGYFYKSRRKNEDPSWNAQQSYRFQFNGIKNLLIFNEKIGFANPKHHKKFTKFLRYSEDYNNKIKNLPSHKQKVAGEGVNQIFYGNMAQGGIEPPTSSS